MRAWCSYVLQHLQLIRTVSHHRRLFSAVLLRFDAGADPALAAKWESDLP